MATVTFIKYKPGGNVTPSAMQAVIHYCLQPYKTETAEHTFCVSGQDCTPAYAYLEFMATKQLYGKGDGVFFYHYVQSFAPDEPITPEEANAIGLELAKQWPGHEVLVATHVDRAHIHNHLIVNSVSHETGKKLHQPPNTLKKLREASDKICLAHGLSVLEPYEKSMVDGVKSGEYRSAVRRDSWKFRLMAAINTAMKSSWTQADFLRIMHDQGYKVAWSDDRVHITYTCLREPPFKDGSHRKCRDNKLHDKKYLKTNMEAEFHARQSLFTETFGGRTHRYEHAAPRADSPGETARPDTGSDRRPAFDGELERPCADAESDFREQRRDAEGDGAPWLRDDGRGEEHREVRDTDGSGRAKAGNLEEDRRDDRGGERTGWESSRGSLPKDRSENA